MVGAGGCDFSGEEILDAVYRSRTRESIVKARGIAKGRYVIPVYYSNLYGLLSAAVVYSDDQGVSCIWEHRLMT